MSLFTRKQPTNEKFSSPLPLSDVNEMEDGSFIIIFDHEGVIRDYKGNVTDEKYIIRIGQHYSDFYGGGDCGKFASHLERVLSGSVQSFKTEAVINSVEFTFSIMMFPFTNGTEAIQGAYCVLKHIQPSDPSMAEQLEGLRSVYVDSQELSGILNKDKCLEFISPAAEQILRRTAKDCIGLPLTQFIDRDDMTKFDMHWKTAMGTPGKPVTFDIRLMNYNGEPRDYQISLVNCLNSENVRGVTFSCKDNQELKKLNYKIDFLTNYDPLTGLPNRQMFTTKCDMDLKIAELTSQQLAMFVLCIKNFEMIGKAFGHEFSDRYAAKIAYKLTGLFSSYVESVARISSNEFAILTKPLKESTCAGKLAEEMQKLFNKPFIIDNYELLFETSLGIAMFPEAGRTTKELLQNACATLHKAPSYCKNSYQFYTSETQEQLKKELTLHKDLATALRKEQFEVFFQPIFNAQSGHIVNAEALLRWNHPDYGAVSPIDFIGLAEKTGDILPIGEWVFGEVCRAVSNWHEAGSKIRAAVNVSAIQFQDEQLAGTFTEIAERFKVGHEWIDIEVTETALLEEEKILRGLSELRNAGFSVVLDDFGTGYNSLKQLQSFEPAKIKVDRSFVSSIAEDKRSQTITSSVIAMAKMLSVEVVAEGVETAEQKQLLEEMECDYFQGYHFSRPMNEVNFTKLLAKQKEAELAARNRTDRRKYFRLPLEVPMAAQMTINEVNGKTIEVGNLNVLIKNIGPGGLYFISTVDLPKREDVVLKFTIKMFGESCQFFGKLARTARESALFGYGVEFQADERTRNEYIQLFHRVEVRLTQPGAYHDLPLLNTSVEAFFSFAEKAQ